MAIYILNIAFIFFTSFLQSNRYKFARKLIDGRDVFLFLVFILFTLIMGLRSSEVGVDTLPYSRIYETIINSNSYIEALEKAPMAAPVYVLFCWALSLVSVSPQILTLVSAVIINFGLVSFIKKTSSDVATSVLVWIGLTLFYCSMNGSRQCISLVLALNALYYLVYNLKSKKGWFLIFVSIGIHTTSLIILLAVFGSIIANKINNNRLTFVTSIIVSGITAIFFSTGVNLLMQFIPHYAMYASGVSRYSIFKSTGSGRIIFLYLFLLFIVILWLLKAKNDNIQNDFFNANILPATVFCAIFGIINCQNELINRLLWFYLALYISFVPSMILKYKNVNGLVIKYGVLITLISYSMLSLSENQNGIMPYSFFWSIP